MTSRRKRNNRLPTEAIPSDPPEKANPPAVPPEEVEGANESASREQEPQEQSAPDEPEFYFPPLKGEGMGGFTLLTERTKNREPIQLPGTGAPRRRKRPNRPIINRPDVSELGQRFESMAYRAAPTFDFFLFSLIAGSILALGYWFDAPAVLLLGILLAPVLTPWVGAMLAAIIGEMAFLKQTIGGFLTSLFIIFITGLLAGLLSRILPMPATQAILHSQLLLFDLLLVAGGTAALTIAFVQSEEKPLLTSIMVAYEIYLPASAAGFGLGSGVENVWPQALMVLLVHLAISITVALIVFYYMGFRPLETSGYLLLGSMAVVSIAVVFAIFVWGNNPRGAQVFGTPVGSGPTLTARPPTLTPIPSATPSPTDIPLTATITMTSGPSPIPTPVYGHISKRGAYLEDEPGGTALTTLDNGYLVEFLPDSPAILEGTTWVRVKAKTTTNRDIVGWVRLDLIITNTPGVPATTRTNAPTATASPTKTETPTVGPSPTPTATYVATGSYSVVNISKFDAALNVRTAAGITNPLAGTFIYTMTDIGKLGPPVTIAGAEWWQVRKEGGVTGWVNSAYLTEYIPSATFCADERVKTLLTDLGTAFKNKDGAALSKLVSPKHGLDIRLVSNNTPVNYALADVSSIFTSNAIQNWGPAPGSDAVKVSGSFIDIIQPKLLEVFNSSYQLSCNDTSKLTKTTPQLWPSSYATINFYSLYKPSTSSDKPDWRDFLVGIEYVDGQPYLFALVHFEPFP